ncbi:MAG: AraC family transcriptional regulator [Clostridiales bacterium]|nr:AraC family transcriptional regulator [Clostridiales bacterium]
METQYESFYESSHDKETHISAWCQKEVNIGAHFHNCLEFIYVHEGKLSASVGSNKILVEPNNLLIISSFYVHSLYSLTEGQYYVLSISRNLLYECSSVLDNYDIDTLTISDDDNKTLFSFMQLIFNMHWGCGIFNNMFPDNMPPLQMRLVATALVLTVIAKSKLTPHIVMTDIVAAAIEYIQNNFRHHILISDISRTLICNSQQLSTQFRQVMKISITDYIKKLRTTEMARLIYEDPKITLNELEEKSGFQSQRSMLRAFRDEYNCTPSEMKCAKLNTYNKSERESKI